MLISISLCWILSAKTHIDDQVDPSVVEKMAVEVQKANEALEANENAEETSKKTEKIEQDETCEEVISPVLKVETKLSKEIQVPDSDPHGSIVDKEAFLNAQKADKKALKLEQLEQEDTCEEVISPVLKVESKLKEIQIPDSNPLEGKDKEATLEAKIQLMNKLETEVGPLDIKSLLNNEKIDYYIENGLGRADANWTFDTSNLIIGSSDTRDTGLQAVMNDAYGDGWNGNSLCVADVCVTLDSGSEGTADFGSFADGDHAVTCGGGSWGSEVSWAIYDYDGNELLTGGAPYEGTLSLGGGSADDGGADDAGDDGGAGCDANDITLVVDGGSWQSEVSWTIDLNEEFVASGGAPSTTELCLESADYTFSGCDAYGDGWNGNTASATDADGNVIFSWSGPTSGIGAGVCEAVTMTVGGAPPVGGCTDPGAPNYDADAEVDDGTCEDYCSEESGSCGYYLATGLYTCEELYGYGIDCSACEADGTCDAETSFTCPDGIVVDAPEDCDGCAFDWTAYGAESCDAAWDIYGLNCATLEANYGWNCAGCECPGDGAADGSDGGGCVDWQGQDCTGYESWVGDGYCDDGSWGMYFNCDEYDCDAGDCGTDCAGVCGGDAVVGCDDVCGSGLEVDDCGVCDGDGSTCECSVYTLVVGGGTYDSEMGWALDDADGNLIATAGCDNPNAYGICEGGGNGTFDLCLYEGFYSFYGYDSWGDGWNGGYWEIFDADGNSVAGGPGYTITEDNYYGWGWGWGLCLGACGCTYADAENYDPDATIEDWSCDLTPGTDCGGYWGAEYAGTFSGCGSVHCYSQADIDASLGDGSCNAHACGGDDPWCHGMACEEFYGCDGGDCSQGDDPYGECYEAPQECEDTACTLEMVDSYGDSWNGNVWTSGDQSAANDGSTGQDPQYADLCFDMDAANVYTCDGGSWQGEVSWTLTCGGDVVASGGAPAEGCFGNCDSVVYGCTDEAACNYNPDATDDDGTCDYGDCNGDCDGDAVVDDCGECGGDGTACADCAYPQWYADGYCDGSNNVAECGYDGGDCCPGDCVDATYECETYGGDCTECADPDSADNQEGGECYDMVVGCTDPDADNYNPDANTDDGSCIYDGCAAGTVPGCSEQDIADEECASS